MIAIEIPPIFLKISRNVNSQSKTSISLAPYIVGFTMQGRSCKNRKGGAP